MRWLLEMAELCCLPTWAIQKHDNDKERKEKKSKTPPWGNIEKMVQAELKKTLLGILNLLSWMPLSEWSLWNWRRGGRRGRFKEEIEFQPSF